MKIRPHITELAKSNLLGMRAPFAERQKICRDRVFVTHILNRHDVDKQQMYHAYKNRKSLATKCMSMLFSRYWARNNNCQSRLLPFLFLSPLPEGQSQPARMLEWSYGWFYWGQEWDNIRVKVGIARQECHICSCKLK